MSSPISSKIVNALALVLLLVVMMTGCNEDKGGVVSVCDNTPPLAGTITPACGATGVALNQKINVTFTENIDSSTVTTATFTLAGPGGTPVSGTVTYVSATNIATFTPASILAANTIYTYTIKGGANGVKDMAGNPLANNFGCSFTTGVAADVTPPTVISTNPANSAVGVPLSKVTSKASVYSKGGALIKTSGLAVGKIITATFSEALDPLTVTSSTITLTGPGNTPVAGLVTYGGTSFNATFIAADNLAPNSTYTGTITTGVRDVAGNALASNYVWTFTTGASPDVTPPTVLSTSPDNNAVNVALNKKIAVIFSEALKASTMSATTFTLKQGATSVLGTVSYTGTTAVFDPSIDLTPSTVYTATIGTGATDVAGNALAIAYVWNFTTGVSADVTPPTVFSTDPANNAIGVALNKIITATFSEAMDPLTVTTTSYTLRQGTTPISGTVIYAGNTVNFIPASPLAANTVYTATMGTGVTDLAGNALASNYVWSFTSAAAADVVPPTIGSTDPANNATGVALNKTITASFSEAMDQSTITTATVTVTGLGGAPVTGAVSYAAGANMVTFKPASNLAANTTYTGTLKGGVTGTKDLAGNALASNYVWSFTTGGIPDNIPPTVVSTDPTNNATGVPLSRVITKSSARAKGAALSKIAGVTAAGKIITATFSEAMDPLTITTSTFTVAGPGATPVNALLVAYTGTSFTATFLAADRLAPNTTYTGTITTGARDLSGNALASNYVWNFTTGAAPDTILPTVISTSPENAATGVALNKKIAATFSEAMNASSINVTTFTLQLGTLLVPGTVTYAGTTALFSPASNLAINTTYTATMDISARDLAGNNMAGNYVWNFTTGAAPDITPPTVILTDPLNNATGVALNKKVSATFSEAMDPLTLGSTTFTLRQGTTVIPGSFTYAGTAEIFTPASALASNTVYTATITTGVKDLAGNAMASNYVWSFTTSAALDVTPPTVLSTDPLNNATGVALNKTVAASFNEAMDASSITAATVTVKGLGGILVTGAVNYVSATNGLTFKSAADLAPSTTFTVTIKGGVTGAKDLAGNPLTNNYVWSFTTTENTPPTVFLTDPICNSFNVPTNKKVAVTFSEAMSAATISGTTFTVTGPPGNTPVTGTVTYVAASNTATFATTNFAFLSTYTFTIHSGASGVKDLAGNPMVNDYVCNFTTGANADNTAPAVLSTDPLNNAIGVALNKIIAATFTESMDPSTITAPGTFTLMQGATSISGTVSYLGTTATFTPTSGLAASTLYTATISTAAQDLAGNPMLSNYVWSFTTASALPAGPAPVDLGSAGDFAILGGSGVTNTSVTTHIYGDVGSFPTATIAGLLAANVTGTLYTSADPIVGSAKTALTAAYNDAQGRSLNAISLPGQLGGLTLAPGLYVNSSTSGISGTGPNGILTLDAGGNPNAVWIFKMGSTFITDAGTSVVLAGGATWNNIYWSVGTSATLGTNSIFYGNILADQSITLTTGAVLYGRALTRIAAVTLDANIVDKR